MNTSHKQKPELKLYYNSEKQSDRKVKGYACSLDKVVVNEQDISQSVLTERQIAGLATDMDIPVAGLLDKNSELYLDKIQDSDYEDQELLKLMHNNADLIKTPIAAVGAYVYFVESPYELIHEDLNFDGIESPMGNKFEK